MYRGNGQTQVSLARGDSDIGSDIDLAAEFDPTAHMDLFRLAALERRLAQLLGYPVDLWPEPVEKGALARGDQP